MANGLKLTAAGLGLACILDGSGAGACDASPLIVYRDDATAPGVTFESPEELADAPFRRFAGDVAGHLRSRLAALGDSPVEGRVTVLRQGLAGPGDEVVPVPTPPEATADACRIVSPWVTLSVRTGAAPRIDGTLLWSERQFLRDRLRSDGDGIAPEGPPDPFPRPVFEAHAATYADEVLLRPPDTPPGDLSALPPELLWLFRRAPQSTRGPFHGMAEGAVADVVAEGAAGQTALTRALIDLCLADGATPGTHRFDDIAAVSGIGRPIIEKPIATTEED